MRRPARGVALIAGLTIQTRNPLFAAFFSFFAARFSIRLFAGFFLVSLFVSLGLLIAGSSDWRGNDGHFAPNT